PSPVYLGHQLISHFAPSRSPGPTPVITPRGSLCRAPRGPRQESISKDMIQRIPVFVLSIYAGGGPLQGKKPGGRYRSHRACSITQTKLLSEVECRCQGSTLSRRAVLRANWRSMCWNQRAVRHLPSLKARPTLPLQSFKGLNGCLYYFGFLLAGSYIPTWVTRLLSGCLAGWPAATSRGGRSLPESR